MLRNRAKRKYGNVAQKIQFLGFYRTVIKKKSENDRSIFPDILRYALGVERRTER